MTQTRQILCAIQALAFAASAGYAQAITLVLPDAAVTSAESSTSLTSYDVPTGAFANGTIPTRTIEGQVRQTAWRIDTPGLTTLELLMPLRAQLTEGGFATLFECEAARCGGFDFRYGIAILPEPEMHVDLGDYRYFAAERGDEVVSLVISRTATSGFVQVTHVGGPASGKPVLTASTKTDSTTTGAGKTGSGGQAVALSTAARPTAPEGPARHAGLGERLLSDGSVALDDLVFASGTSALAKGDYASLRELAAWLAENPRLTIALIGHTDASGGLEANIALSRKRADAVRDYLITVLDVAPSRLEAQGVGYLSPRSSNLTEDGRRQNRRVEVMVTSTQVAP